MLDIVIIGMGIGGITAGIYAKRANMDILMLDKSAPGGLLNGIDKISNYPGLIDIPGSDFSMKLLEQVNSMEIPYKLEEVLEIIIEDDKKIVKTNKDEYVCKNIILATGTKPKFLGLDNERELLGRGISTCAVCDGNFYKGKDIAVVGSGNSALQESLYLSKIVNKVYLLNKRIGFKGEEYLEDKVKNTPNIEIKYNVNIEKYNETEDKIESIVLNNGEVLNVSGVFIYIGYKPNTELVNNFDILNMEGRVLVDENCETKIPGLYAIGDVIKKDVYQLVTAASDGIIAVMNISKEK